MKKRWFLLIILAVFLITAAITNPTKDDFVTWAKEQLKKENNELVGWGIELLGDRIINSVTTGEDYVVFSIYEATISDTESVKVIGIFNNFIPLDMPE